MSYLSSKLFVGLVILGSAGDALAQMGPGPMGPMGPGMGGPQTPAGEEKKEGVAEAAPKTPGLLPTTPALPPPKGRRKRYKLVELEGYYRIRSEWMKNFNLNFNDDPTVGGAPFPRALGCSAATSVHAPCNDSVTGEDMRLRLEPVFNIDEGTSVHMQADVFDNMVLGSTAYGEGLNGQYTSTNGVKPPLGAFGDYQGSVLQGVNSDRPSILVKRAWAEVAVPLGILKFGRMPNQWGMGIWANAGGYDPINGTYNYDADYGDTVDRVSFTAAIPGTGLRAMVAMDWNNTGLASNQTSANVGHEEHPFDLDDSDDSTSWVAVVSKMDSAQDFKDIVDRGESAFNYGAYFQYKTQSWAENLTDFNLGNTFDSTDHYVPRDYKTYTTSLWAKFGTGGSLVEAELVGTLGDLNRATDLGNTQSISVRKFGGAGRYTWKGVEGKLRLGLETGFASGDQYDNSPQGATNIAFANLLGNANTTKLTQFIFNRDYFVDMIFWRHLVGAVTNASYIKPFLSYDLTKSITVKVANINSIPLDSISTPGNGRFYGTEFDGDLSYSTGHFIAGIAYGVFFPFGALAHPEDSADQGGPGFNYNANGITNTGDPGTAHLIQLRCVLAF